MTNHKCCFNGKGICDYCGKIKGLTPKETAKYLEMLRDDWKDSEIEFWELHSKTLK